MKHLLYRFLSVFLLSGCSHYNPLKVRQACRSKSQAKAIFAKNKLSCAEGEVFINPVKAFLFAKKYGFPLVIKPNVGGFSRGAYFPIENNWQLLKASILVKKWWAVSIIERYLLGQNYRIVMTKFGLMSIIKRYPPFVIGDGKLSIAALIDQENQARQAMGLFPAVNPIPKNSAIRRHLKKQYLTFDTVLKKGRRIYLHHKISLKLGSVVRVMDKANLSTHNQQKAAQVLDFVGANILGIDVICEHGLEVDFEQQKCIFLELNSRPLLSISEFPRFGKKQDLSVFYQQLDALKIDNKNIF